ncbi:MAG: glutaminyl-peptide cyclotransferase, partial [Acidobacteria bacterium]
AFTQGLLWYDGALYESTGLHGRSEVRRTSPWSGAIEARHVLDPQLFGEGLARVGERLVQLTWQSGIALVYDLRTLTPVDSFAYEGEGWGLTYDGSQLIMSDGSSTLSRRDAADFALRDVLEVTLDGRPLRNLNELEWAGGAIYANLWQDDRIVRIDPASGRVTAVIDAAGLLAPAERARVDVLNGIAYDPASETFWLTGKLWPKTFQVRFVPATSPQR